MTAELIDGKAFSVRVRGLVGAHVARLAAQGIVPGLAVVLVGE
ncbi:bifunctional methylenetetrahydrofolate dehydrogenase/methenyltetrahydrofolate cyclohydrolase, partial [Paracoccus sp. PAR01]|nr:bifunctional methylenetetrahydrofolate dehydrogenase/methenyltetrahydrofolate cyclohydrolase [Paracoccus sp. PAR01]MBD9529606.1 bifunctional methylenetetrahydrofolate dehydrogenase/methenyltetrahydrofolate cyclohydrolase [Paracoccus sp. PAR01]